MAVLFWKVEDLVTVLVLVLVTVAQPSDLVQVGKKEVGVSGGLGMEAPGVGVWEGGVILVLMVLLV